MNLKDLFKKLDSKDVWLEGVPAENLEPTVQLAALSFSIKGVRYDELGPVIELDVDEDLAMLLDLWLEYRLEAKEHEIDVHITPAERVQDFALYQDSMGDEEFGEIVALWREYKEQAEKVDSRDFVNWVEVKHMNDEDPPSKNK
jgi:hypothetical protein